MKIVIDYENKKQNIIDSVCHEIVGSSVMLWFGSLQQKMQENSFVPMPKCELLFFSERDISCQSNKLPNRDHIAETFEKML